jgi:hypothetical protein
LGSRYSSQTHDGDVLMACCLVKKYGTHVIKICCNTNLGAGNTMVASELTGGVTLVVLLVFLGCWKWGPYINPDQQGVLCKLQSLPNIKLNSKF